MSSKSTASRLGSFFGIGNKHSSKRAASEPQIDHLGGFRDTQQNTLPSGSRPPHGAPYMDTSRGASDSGLPAQNPRTQPDSRRSNSKRYPHSLYTLPDVDPFAATSQVALPTSPDVCSPSDYNSLQPPSNTRPLPIQTSPDTTVPVPSPFGSPIDHGQNASGYSVLYGRLVFPS
jgi:hypothetical protein